MGNIAAMLGKYNLAGTPSAPAQPSAPLAAVPAPTAPAAAVEPTAGAISLFESIRKITLRAKVLGAIMTIETEGIDPAGIVDGLKEIDSGVTFETQFGGGGYRGDRKGDKKASVVLILVRKFGADVTGKTPEGEDVTASIWKDKMAEVLGALTLTDAEKDKVAKGIAGQLNPALLSLEGRGFEMSYWERDKDGVKSLNVSELHATATNGNGHHNGNGAGATA